MAWRGVMTWRGNGLMARQWQWHDGGRHLHAPAVVADQRLALPLVPREQAEQPPVDVAVVAWGPHRRLSAAPF
jgi:hypothetical protein